MRPPGKAPDRRPSSLPSRTNETTQSARSRWASGEKAAATEVDRMLRGDPGYGYSVVGRGVLGTTRLGFGRLRVFGLGCRLELGASIAGRDRKVRFGAGTRLLSRATVRRQARDTVGLSKPSIPKANDIANTPSKWSYLSSIAATEFGADLGRHRDQSRTAENREAPQLGPSSRSTAEI